MRVVLLLLLAFALYGLARAILAGVLRLFRHPRLAPWQPSLEPLAAPGKALLGLLAAIAWTRAAAALEAPSPDWVEYYAWILFWTSLVWLAIRAANVIILGIHYQRSKGAPLPGVFRAIVNGTLYILVFVVVLHRYYGIAIGDLVFWGAALAVVLGIALQSMIWSLFAGLVIYYQDAFRVGDTIRVGEVEGTVLEIDWRTTALRSPSGEQITVPNWTVSQATIVNFVRPSRPQRAEVELRVRADAPPNAVARLLEETAAMAEGVVADPAPRAHLEGGQPGCAAYRVVCWVGEHAARAHAEDGIRRLAWYRLRRRGWSPDDPAGAAEAGPDPRVAAALERLELLSPFAEARRVDLGARLPAQLYGRDELLFRAGVPVDAVYCVLSGSLRRAGGGERLESAVAGEAALVLGRPAPVDVRVAEDAELVALPRALFRELLLAEPGAVQALAARFAGEAAQVEELSAAIRSRFQLDAEDGP